MDVNSVNARKRRNRARSTIASGGSNSEKSGKGSRSILWFMVRFSLILVVAGIVYTQVTAAYRGPIDWLTRFTASVCGSLLAAITDTVTYSGRTVTLDGFSVEIIDECTGAFEALIFVSAVLAFATSIRKKLYGLAIGLPLIYLFNLLRVGFLLVIGAYWPDSFGFFHGYFWQGTLIFMIGVTWLAWLRMVVIHEPKTHAVSG